MITLLSLKKHVTAASFLSLSLVSLNMVAQNSHRIELLNSNTMEFDKALGNGAKRLIGNVKFKQNEAIMSCDSAYFYDDNTVDAFGSIHINQGDTVHLYGDLLHYDGNEKLAKIRNNVKLIDKATKLTTQAIEYNTRDNIAYYTDGGKITNGPDSLESVIGHYYANQKMFYFHKKVRIKNVRYTIFSDTLNYQTIIRQAYFFGPTRIISKENLIYCENGWYNTLTNKAQFQKNAYLQGKGQRLKGDSITYDRNKSFGRAFHNVQLIDSAHNTILKGHYGEYCEKPESALMTDKAQLIKIDNKGDSLFIHSDTLRMQLDTTGLYRQFASYYGVRLYKSDIQGICDSLTFSFADSTFRMYHNPVLWSGENQISANFIDLVTRNNEMKEAHIVSSAMMVSKEDTALYNQVKGRDMLGIFVKNELTQINVTGNSQTVYYPKDGAEIIGMNRAESTNLQIFLEDRKVRRIRFITQPTATLFPLKIAPAELKILKGFQWHGDERPLSSLDIFRTIKK